MRPHRPDLTARRSEEATSLAVWGQLAPSEYLRLRRVAAGYDIDRFARDYAVLAARAQADPIIPCIPARTREAHLRLRGELALLERDGAVATSDGTLLRIAMLIPFDPAVYRQLATEPAERHPRVCRGCGCSGHDACSTDDSVCTWVTPAWCSYCDARADAGQQVAA